MHTEFYIQ